jgi:hypothetical protein
VTKPGILVALETQSATGLESRFGARSTYILKSEPLQPEIVRELVKNYQEATSFALNFSSGILRLAPYCTAAKPSLYCTH